MKKQLPLYGVRINMNDDTHRFVSLKIWHKPNLVRRKDGATKMESGAAEVVSNWFWHNHWDRETMYSRETVRITRGDQP